MLNSISNTGFIPQRSSSAKPGPTSEESPSLPQDSLSLGSDVSLSAGDGLGTQLGWRSYGSYSNWNTSTERSLGYKETNTHVRAGSHETIKGDDGTLYYHDEHSSGHSSGTSSNGIICKDTAAYVSRFSKGRTYIRD